MAGWNDTTKTLSYPFTKLAKTGRGDLENALGYTATSQEDLFISGGANIVKWAKYKYIKDSSVMRMTTAQRKAKNQGFTGIIFSSAANAFDAAAASGADWTYERPAIGAAYHPFRAWDFMHDGDPTDGAAGYNGLAKNPFSLYMAPVQGGGGGTGIQGYYVYQIVWNYTTEEINLTDLNAFNDEISSTSSPWYWCVLANIQGLGKAAYTIYSDTACTTPLIALTPSGSRTVGYFKIPQNAQVTGWVTAYFGVQHSTSGKIIYIPLLSNVNFQINEPAAEVAFDWASNTDGSQPTPYQAGINIAGQVDSTAPGGLRVAGVKTTLVLTIPPGWSGSVSFTIVQEVICDNGTITQTDSNVQLTPSAFTNNKLYIERTWAVGASTHFALNANTTIGVKYVYNGSTYYPLPHTLLSDIPSDRISLTII